MPQTPEEIVVFLVALLLLVIALGIMVILLIKLGIYISKKLDEKKHVAFQNRAASEDEELNSILTDCDIE